MKAETTPDNSFALEVLDLCQKYSIEDPQAMLKNHKTLASVKDAILEQYADTKKKTAPAVAVTSFSERIDSLRQWAMWFTYGMLKTLMPDAVAEKEIEVDGNVIRYTEFSSAEHDSIQSQQNSKTVCRRRSIAR